MKMQSPAGDKPAVPLPRLVLRVAFAGSQRMSAAHAAAAERLAEVWTVLGQRLTELAPATNPLREGDGQPRVRAFYSNELPLLRLVTGLCEGADDWAVRALDQAAASAALLASLATELAAVLPGALLEYRTGRPEHYRARFDELAQRCSYVLVLDGILKKPDPDIDLAKKRRARAYRAQSAVLLRQADVLVAVADLDQAGRAGGTLETVRAALAFGMPVVLIHLGDGGLRLIEPDDDLDAKLDESAETKQGAWEPRLRQWTTRIVADPRTEQSAGHAQDDVGPSDVGPSIEQKDEAGEASFGHKLLEEYFYDADVPKYIKTADGKVLRKIPRLESTWDWFKNRVGKRKQAAKKKTISDPELKPFSGWRGRAAHLNYHYSGQYRGAFTVNYLLAFIAVTLAVLSLGTIIGLPHAGQLILLPLLGLGKLVCVVGILRNSEREHHGEWNDRAVDYRYLAERLRAMYYLPLLGSVRPPAASAPHYANRVVRQSAVDWLVDALVRTTSPLEIAPNVSGSEQGLAIQQAQLVGENGSEYSVKLIELHAVQAIELIRHRWLAQQSDYHHDNATQMDRMHEWATKWGEALNQGVIGIVVIDLLVLAFGLLASPCIFSDELCWIPHLGTEIAEKLHHYAPLLVGIAAILPAAVASLNGLRFQSEFRRLADRSAVMRVTIRGRETRKNGKLELDPTGSLMKQADDLLAKITSQQNDPANNGAAWTHEALRFGEAVAQRMTKETADWSVLYAKEVPEP